MRTQIPTPFAIRFDSVVNSYLIERCSFDPSASSHIGLVVHSACEYMAPVGFPALLELGLRVNRLGRSSVTYEIGLFEKGDECVKAIGSFVHVFVDRRHRKSTAEAMDEGLGKGLAAILVNEQAKL